MTPQLNNFLLSAPLAVAVPALALWKADAPFGWWQVLAVYLLATLPLSFVVARRIETTAGPRLLAAAGVVIGSVLGVATAFEGSRVSSWLGEREANLLIRQGTLGMWCVLLQVPWFLVGRLAEAPEATAKPAPPSWTAGLLSLFTAAALPTVYLTRLIDVESQRAEEMLKAGREARAAEVAKRLVEVGSSRLLDDYLPYDVYRGFRFRHLYRWSREPRNDAERMEKAAKHAAWGESEGAIELLLPLSGRDPAAALLLASVYKEQQKWKECGQYCRLALALLDRVPPSEAAITGRVQAYDNLAAAAQEQKQYDEARKIYEEAIRRVPPAEAHFHYQLGRLHHLAGRPGKALHHLETARKLDPEGQTEKTQKLLDDIRTQTPGCLLRWFGGYYYSVRS